MMLAMNIKKDGGEVKGDDDDEDEVNDDDSVKD